MSTNRPARKGANPPTLSLAERDRRWTRVREFMVQENLDALLIGGFRAREMYESYVSDDYNEGCVIFPLQGDPVVVTWAPLRVKRAQYSASQGHRLWIEDYRVAASGKAVADLVTEMGLSESRMGIVGLRSIAPTEQYGSVPAGFWLDFVSVLPRLQYRDVSEPFSYLMLIKSAEEINQMRYAAQAAEAACKVIADLVEPGVGEEEIFAAACAEMLSHGIGLRYPMIVMNSGPHTLSWGPPRWTTRGEAPRTLVRGDLLQAELMPMCGNQEAHDHLGEPGATTQIARSFGLHCVAACTASQDIKSVRTEDLPTTPSAGEEIKLTTCGASLSTRTELMNVFTEMANDRSSSLSGPPMIDNRLC